DALLHVRGPLIRRRPLAEQVWLERLHARDDEEHRWVVGDQGGRRHDGVPLLLEVGKEAAGDLGRLHQWPSSGCASWSVAWSVIRSVERVEPAAGCLARYSSMPSRTSRVNR